MRGSWVLFITKSHHVATTPESRMPEKPLELASETRLKVPEASWVVSLKRIRAAYGIKPMPWGQHLTCKVRMQTRPLLHGSNNY